LNEKTFSNKYDSERRATPSDEFVLNYRRIQCQALIDRFMDFELN